MFFPKLTAAPQQRRTVDRFLGLDRRAGSAMGSFQNMENLWAGGYPALETRPARGTAAALKAPHGLVCRDAPVWVDGTALYVNGDRTGLVLTDGDKQLVSMGAYLLIWPDKKYINTQDLTEFGGLENRTVTTGEVTVSLCRSSGEELGSYSIGEEAPASPGTGSLWMDTADGEPVLKRYDGSSWLEVEDVCTKAASAGIGRGFRAGDGVTVAGCETEGLDGLHVLQAVDDDWIVVPVMCRTVGSQTAAVTVTRSVPDMDFVVEQGNRLWGCKYGIVNGEPVNEIYASKLGDFRNWNSFAGLSTDSYAAARGSDGPFTGAAACQGGVVFFKENCMERVYPAAGGGHQIVTMACNGEKRYAGGVGGGESGRYWLAARSSTGAWELLVYDTARKLWHREDDKEMVALSRYGGAMMLLCRDGTLLDTSGTYGTKEAQVDWSAETGDLGLYTPEHKYLERLQLRLELASGASATAYVCYDGGSSWEKAGSVTGDGRTGGYVMQVRPRRCGHLRLKLAGSGGCRLYSASAVYEKGSDGP